MEKFKDVEMKRMTTTAIAFTSSPPLAEREMQNKISNLPPPVDWWPRV